jgi:formate dehydrogenase beta subunit
MNESSIALQTVRRTLPSRRMQPQVAPDAAPAWALDDVDAAVAGFGGAPLRRDRLIEYLHAINDREGVLTTPHLHALAQRMKLAPVEVYEVASFYHHFEIARIGDDARPARDPRPVIRVCDGLSCALAGAAGLHQALESALAGKARVVHAPCVGRCETAPVAVVHQNAVPDASVETVRKAVAAKAFAPELPQVIGLAAYKKAGGYRLWRELVSGQRKPEDITQALDDAGLRGLGGAGFPAGRKWKIVRAEPAPRLMAVNIDEGEPGTFKDRWYLERDPHRFLEGMLVAAWCVQIGAVYIYLRDEYHGLRAVLQREIDALRADPSLHPLPPIELRRGAGAYICGEESAMIESIEGKRGMPRLRPPYVAQVGLFGRPTLEHNYETLHWVREIVERGAEWFASHGRHGRKGLRSFSVSGRVKHPGVKLAPAGITLRELIDEHCGGMQPGHELYAYLPGGASGGILPAALADVPLDFDTIQPHGGFIGSAAVIVLSTHDRATDAARNLMKFFEDESCGQCTPCRAGTTKVRALIDGTNRWDRDLLAELSQVMRDASICGLGQAAPNPVDCVIRYFPQELQA